MSHWKLVWNNPLPAPAHLAQDGPDRVIENHNTLSTASSRQLRMLPDPINLSLL